MDARITGLGPRELRVLAGIRLAVAARLAAAAAAVDPGLGASIAGKVFVLALRTPSLPAVRIGSDGSSARVLDESRARRAFPSLTLLFPSDRACASVLSGGPGTPLPLPSGPGALAALAFFRAAAPRAAAIAAGAAGGPGSPAAAAARARLLAEAALAGLAAVGGLDRGLAERVARMPDGTVAVEAAEAFALGIEKRSGAFRVLSEPPASPNARLTFAGAAEAVAVLSGKRPAVVALGSGEVTVRGLLPLAQGLFAILDRLGEYLAVETKEAAR